MKSLAERIKELRAALGMSQTELAKAIGVSQNAVAMWESGARRHPRGETVLRLAKALGTTPDGLYQGLDPQHASATTAEHKRLIEQFERLSQKNKELVLALVKALQ